MGMDINEEDVAEAEGLVEAVLLGLLERKKGLGGKLDLQALQIIPLTCPRPSKEVIMRLLKSILLHDQAWVVSDVMLRNDAGNTWCLYLRATHGLV